MVAAGSSLTGCASFRFQGQQTKLRAEAGRLTRQAREALSRGRASLARTLLNQSLACCPQDTQAMALLAEADLAGGDAAEAIQTLTAAIEHSPQRADLRVRLGQAWLESGQLQQARQQAGSAVTLDPGLSAAWQLLGDVAAAEGHLEEALAGYQRAAGCELAPANLQLKIAGIYQKQERHHRALSVISQYHAGLGLDVFCPEGLLQEGEILIAIGQYGRATERLTLATQQENCRPESYVRLSQALWMQGRSVQSQQTMVAARDRWPDLEPLAEIAVDLEQTRVADAGATATAISR